MAAFSSGDAVVPSFHVAHAFPVQFRVHSVRSRCSAGCWGTIWGESPGCAATVFITMPGLAYPRHLKRALDFPGSAHPRQERGGATLTQQHGVTAPGDDAGHVDLEGNHQVGDQDSFHRRRVAGPVLPSLSGNGQSRPVTEHRPPAWGQQVLQGDYWVQILGTVHRQPKIQIRYRSNFAVPVSQMCSVMQLENRAGTTMTPALSQRPWSTSRRFTPIRRWAGGLIRMIPAFGHRSYRSSRRVSSGASVPFPVRQVGQIR